PHHIVAVSPWTPTASCTASIQTCGAVTSFDTVPYLRRGACASGPEVAAGCNDDTCANASGLFRASRITPTVTAGQPYFIVVDGYAGATGTFSLTVTPPGASTTTTTLPPTTTTTRPPTTTSSSTTTTTTRPPPTTSSSTTTSSTRPPPTTTSSTTTSPTPPPPPTARPTTMSAPPTHPTTDP